MTQLRRLGRRLPRTLREAVWRRTLARRSRVRWGNLRRREPFSRVWGTDRGMPVDRVYIERFLQEHASDVRGRTLEIGGPLYTSRFGGDRVARAEVLDIDPENELATIRGDLADPATLPEGAIDCFVLTQTLQFIPDAEAALANAYRCLAPAGVLLLTVPSLSQLRAGGEDLWRWAPRGAAELVGRALPDEAESILQARGNLLTCLAFLLGLAADELDSAAYEHDDRQYPLVVCARIRKPG